MHLSVWLATELYSDESSIGFLKHWNDDNKVTCGTSASLSSANARGHPCFGALKVQGVRAQELRYLVPFADQIQADLALRSRVVVLFPCGTWEPCLDISAGNNILRVYAVVTSMPIIRFRQGDHFRFSERERKRTSIMNEHARVTKHWTGDKTWMAWQYRGLAEPFVFCFFLVLTNAYYASQFRTKQTNPYFHPKTLKLSWKRR